MGHQMPPADEGRVFVALGEVRADLAVLAKRFDELDTRTTKEQRTVHDIVVATSEAVRILTRLVDEMKPYVESYKMKAEKLDDAIAAAKAYQVEKAEERGAERYKSWIYGLVASAGGLVVFVLGKLFDKLFTAGPTLPPGGHP